MAIGLSPTTGQQYYSGTVSDIKQILSAMDIGEGKLARFGETQVAFYQETVDRAIDEILGELYHVPLIAINQMQPNGLEVQVFPGSVKMSAMWWVAGLILKNQFQQLAQNSSDQSEQYIEKAKKDIYEIVRYNHRLYGQRRKSSISRTMPPNMQPPMFPELNV